MANKTALHVILRLKVYQACWLHIAEPAEDVVEVREDHQQDQDAEADVLGTDHKGLRGLTTGDHLIDEE